MINGLTFFGSNKIQMIIYRRGERVRSGSYRVFQYKGI